MGLALCLSGCTSMLERLGWHDPDADRVAYVVSLHQLAGAASENSRLRVVMQREGGAGPLDVRRIPLLTSRVFRTADMVALADGTVAVRGHLSAHGRLLWMQVCAEHSGTPVAVAVDGAYRFLWEVPRPSQSDGDSVTIRGPWGRREAELITGWAPRNFAKQHRR